MMKCVNCVFTTNVRANPETKCHIHSRKQTKKNSVYTRKIHCWNDTRHFGISFFFTIHLRCYLRSVCRLYMCVCVLFFGSLFNGGKFLIWHSKWWMYANTEMAFKIYFHGFSHFFASLFHSLWCYRAFPNVRACVCMYEVYGCVCMCVRCYHLFHFTWNILVVFLL